MSGNIVALVERYVIKYSNPNKAPGSDVLRDHVMEVCICANQTGLFFKRFVHGDFSNCILSQSRGNH